MLDANFEYTTAVFDTFGEDDDASDDEDLIMISAAEILSRKRSGFTDHSQVLPGLTLFDSSQAEYESASAHGARISSAGNQTAPLDRSAQLTPEQLESLQSPQLSRHHSSSYTVDFALATLETDLAHILGSSTNTGNLQRSHRDGP